MELVVTETTYNTFNESKYGEFLKRNGEAVPTFIRAMIANWNCDSIAQWISDIKNEISWTYNNNYMLVDYAEFKKSLLFNTSEERKKSILEKQILYSIEIVTGLLKEADET